jgi:hypothetical protein
VELDRFKIYLQNYLADGLMLVIGSGLSCGEGLPSMTALEDAIHTRVSAIGPREIVREWTEIRLLLTKHGLEGALHQKQPSSALGVMMAEAIAEAVHEKERQVISSVLAGDRTLPLTRLLPLMAIGSEGAPILTTNYDRLVELACCRAGVWVDTLFDGEPIGSLASDRWKIAQVESWQRDRSGGRQRARYRTFARVLKPHGSLDWWQSTDGPIRFSGQLPTTRAIVTPGLLKYREGYNEPFNTHRNIANEHLAKCGRLMFIGYGFNDDHLEATSLMPLLQAGKEALIVALSLSDNARRLVAELPKVTAIESMDPDARTGTRIYFQSETHELPSERWWSLEELVKGVWAP